MPPLQFLIPYFVVLLMSLSFHEAAHAWTADRLGDPTARRLGRLTLNPLAHIDWIGTVAFPLIALATGFPLFGWAKPVPVVGSNLRHPRRDFAIVAVAGPISNLILAAMAAMLLRLLWSDAGESGALVLTFLEGVVLVNVLLAVFNLVPVPPLDGGNVLAGLLPESAARVMDHARPYGVLILYALLFTGAFRQVVWPVANAIQEWLL